MRRSHYIFLCAALAGLPATARADDPGASLEKGKALYDEATKLIDAKKYDEACSKLQESIKLVPVAVGARLALGECEEGRGHLASAIAAYREAQSLAAAAGQPDRGKQAKDRADGLQSRVGSIEILLGAADASLTTLAVELDGKPLDAEHRRGPILVDAGRHTVHATATGRTPFDSGIDVKDGDRARVPISLPVPGAAVTAGPTVTAAPTETSAPSSPVGSGGTAPLRTVGIIAGGLGIVGIAVGGTIGGLAISKNQESVKTCPTKGMDNFGTCTEPGISLRKDAYSLAAVSTGTFIAGGALLAAGVLMFLVAPGGKKGDRTAGVSIGVAPTGVLVQGRFQ